MKRRQRGMFLLQSVAAMALFSVGVLAVLMLSASAKRQSADAHYRAAASALAADLIAHMRLGPVDAAASGFAGNAARVLPGVEKNPPVIDIGDGGIVVVTLYWQAPGDASAHQHVVATRIAD